MNKIKLSEWAKKNGVTYRTAWNHFKAGKLKDKTEITETGAIYVLEDALIQEKSENCAKSLDKLTLAIEKLTLALNK